MSEHVNAANGALGLLGQVRKISHTVEEKDTASQWGNELLVLATPVLLWLSEIAAMGVFDESLPEGWMSLGLSHDSRHIAPTPLGETITISAELTAIGHNKLFYRVSATDENGLILNGQHVRAVVPVEAFKKHVASRSGGDR